MRILIVEDHALLRESIQGGLAGMGHAVTAASDGEQGCSLALQENFDLLILDIMLPKINGLEVVRQVRAAGKGVAILLLTARDGVDDRVEGLDLGADDYVTKPFAVSELLARVRALLRRGGSNASPVIRLGALTIDTVGRTASRDGREIALTVREFTLLEYLATRSGAVVSRAEIHDHLYADGKDPDSNAVDVFVSRLRRKLSPDGQPPLIQTRRGHGYRLA